jgi:hypothetical protein
VSWPKDWERMIVVETGTAAAVEVAAAGAGLDSTTGDGTMPGAGIGTSNDFWRTGESGEGSVTVAGAGGGALSDFVAIGKAVGVGAWAWCPCMVDPVERSTRMRGADLPAKNSAAVREDSVDGAGGNISAWKESAWVHVVRCYTIYEDVEVMHVLFVER